MKRKVWIFNHYAGKMFFNHGGRHYNFAKFLNKEGYSPVVFCCNAKHSGNKELYFNNTELWSEHIAEDINTPFVYVRGRTYLNNGKDRVLNMLDFYFNLKKTAKEYAKEKGKPDIILASSVHPLTLLAGIQLAKYFGVKCICEMRDLWPEAIISYSKKISKNSLIAKLMYAGEKWLYKKADALIFTQEGGPDYIIEQGWDKAHGGPVDMSKAYHINNGVDLDAFEYNKEHFYLEDDDMDDVNTYKVVYAGSIRRVNKVGIIVDIAKKIQNPKVKFIIWGDGDELEALKQRVIDERINNVIFKGYINKQYIPSVVSRADINIVHWDTTPIIRVGESCNKTFECLAAGRLIFYTLRPGYSIVEKYNCGKMTKGSSVEDLVKGIEELIVLSQDEKQKLCFNAIEAAKEYDFANLTEKLIEIIEKV